MEEENVLPSSGDFDQCFDPGRGKPSSPKTTLPRTTHERGVNGKATGVARRSWQRGNGEINVSVSGGAVNDRGQR